MNQTTETTNNQRVRMAAPIPRSKENESLHQAHLQSLEQLSQAEAAETTVREQLRIGDAATRKVWQQASDDLQAAQKQATATWNKEQCRK